ncbi:unnamed protein product [Rotaria socialis]|uniref:Pericentrin/AKAP-450 centrosomal targeting domain-containing protein n=1 Tax=Rotaria socialis TaxID=392032 RepID=A0A820M0I8_9BILA|nr:unnamed protein product [Rotaria socialis]CAF3187302.1 unnamed protein product [Rotaria socialis]CAF3301621.1 unnamed protein product [Rotaria socialis]CAF3338607.1 unnamed protein product [Rotaria socialis]CAF3416458.1 unnamed protein product [Rotaria socialis]
MPSLHQQSHVIELETAKMTVSPEIDWRKRYEQLQFEHQLEIERIRLHYDHELKEKLTEIRMRLKHEYDRHFAEFRARLLEQQQVHNVSSHSLNLDQSLGEKILEQVRIAEEYDRLEDEKCRQLLSQQPTDSDELKPLVNKLHTEGIHVLTLSELLSLKINGINIGTTDASIGSIQKLNEENSYLRSLIANMNANDSGDALIKCLAEIFRCEQERRSIEIRNHKKYDQLEQDIQNMCEYQRDALGKLLSQDRVLLIKELEETKEQVHYLKDKFDQIKKTQNQSTILNSHNLNKFYFKYLRCEAYRKALIYQKRYLLILLTGYEDTETYALREIKRLTGNMKSSVYDYHQIKSISKQKYHRRAFNYRFRFRCYVTVVIGMIRMRWLVKKWARKLTSIQ